MADRRLFNLAIKDIEKNPEQLKAVYEKGHCTVLAGPGSGKTKTLTVAMARALLEDVKDPRGIACITYNNECAIELSSRLSKLGIESSGRVFIGTVHSFALTQVIFPYARCTMPEISKDIRVATATECREAVEKAHKIVFNVNEDPHDRWKFAEFKRRRDVDRSQRVWRDQNADLADFIEAYEKELRKKELIDFDDMPILALHIIRDNEWVRNSLRAKFPILFVDEYQDLGYSLHELVLLLCFKVGVRLFAVGDPDQSIYAFTGADPMLLESITDRPDVQKIPLRFNYRCGKSIIEASMAALGAERDYCSPDDAEDGVIDFHGIDGDLDLQAEYIFSKLLPYIQNTGVQLEKIAILYKWAKHGEEVVAKAKEFGILFVRSDTNALIKRNSKISRFIEACANWVSGGWKQADPPFRRLAFDAIALVFGQSSSDKEKLQIQSELIYFLKSTIGTSMSTHQWLSSFRQEVLNDWRKRSRTISEDWDSIDIMIKRTDPTKGDDKDLPLAHFGGRIEGTGRLNLSTLHSSKGREFDAVILFGMNYDIIPNGFERRNEAQFKESRRLFYV
jgi:DNA helicase-2/ATP-dependent DNA helicase PcrA